LKRYARVATIHVSTNEVVPEAYLRAARSHPEALLAASRHTREHTSRKEGGLSGSPELATGDVSRCFSLASHLVWGGVVPDIPDFCRELVAALAEE
jgi:hypothetical protein